MIRVAGALLSDIWAKTYREVNKPRVGRVLTEVGGWCMDSRAASAAGAK